MYSEHVFLYCVTLKSKVEIQQCWVSWILCGLESPNKNWRIVYHCLSVHYWKTGPVVSHLSEGKSQTTFLWSIVYCWHDYCYGLSSSRIPARLITIFSSGQSMQIEHNRGHTSSSTMPKTTCKMMLPSLMQRLMHYSPKNTVFPFALILMLKGQLDPSLGWPETFGFSFTLHGSECVSTILFKKLSYLNQCLMFVK